MIVWSSLLTLSALVLTLTAKPNILLIIADD